MFGPELLDLDIHSADGAALLAAVRKRHGDEIARAASLLDRLFLLRSPWAPGLRCVGGEITGVSLVSAEGRAHQFSLTGASCSLEDALASCVAEGIERISCIERASDVAAFDSPGPSNVMPAAREFIAKHLLAKHSSDLLIDASWMQAKSCSSDSSTVVPADWCLRRSHDGTLRVPGTALSTGVAAGPTHEEAAERALLELVERDAASLWWLGGARGRHVAIDSDAGREATYLLSLLRDGVNARRTWLLDITTNLNIPCIVALSANSDATGLCCGLAARLTMPDAVHAAVLEMCQIELGLLIALAKQATGGERSLTPTDRRHIERAAINADRCDLLHPTGVPATYASGEAGPRRNQLARLEKILSNAGIEVAVVDHTRSGFNIPVVRAIAPQLQQMPCDIVVGRLDATRQVTGGGTRWTRSVALI